MALNIKLAHAIGGLSVIVTILLLLWVFFQCVCIRKLRATVKKKTMSVSEAEIEIDPQSGQVFLQWKGELDDEGSRLYELAAKNESPEIGADGERYELSVSERSERTRNKQELWGGEHSKELEAPPR